MNTPVYYLPISDPDMLLEGISVLLLSLIQQVVERHLNDRSNYTDKARVRCVKILKLEI